MQFNKILTSLGLLTLIFTINIVKMVTSQCAVNIQNDLPQKDPVYLRNTSNGFDVWVPVDGPELKTNNGTEHVITCSGSGNSLTLNMNVSNIATCISGTTFQVDGIQTSSELLECKNTITGDYLNTQESCTDGGTIVNMGWDTENYGFITYITGCYNMKTGSTIYTKHKLSGRSLKYAVIVSIRPTFKSAGTASHVQPATSYKIDSQLARLTILLGSAEQATKFIYNNSYMARGHLTPDGDGIYRSWQFTTYFYLNAAPQWQVFNAGNWLYVENAVRTKGDNVQDDLLIFTGTHGILTLPHINGTQIEITLEDGDNIEVPKWFWKIIKWSTTNSAIALIGLNNPFVTYLTNTDQLCQNICESSGWNQSHFTNFEQGYVYCCNVNELMKVVPRIPAEAAADNVLYF